MLVSLVAVKRWSKLVSDISCEQKDAIIKVRAKNIVEKRNEGAHGKSFKEGKN